MIIDVISIVLRKGRSMNHRTAGITTVALMFVGAALFSSAVGYSQGDDEYVGVKSCLVCHPIKGDKREVTIGEWDKNAHAKLPKGCEACHGAGKAHVDLGIVDLMAIKKKKGDLKIVVDKTNALCAKCHTLNDGTKVALYSDDLVLARQENNEMAANKHTKFKVTCIFCHDAHASVTQPKGIRRKCLVCHTGKFKVEVKIKAMADLTCEDCHMPYAARHKKDEMVQGYHKGDFRSHVFGISVDPDYKLNDGTNNATLTKEGLARMTVEMTCYACHKTGKAPDISRDRLLKAGAKIH